MKLADYLTKHKISQKTLADHLGVSQGRVWQWLNGEPVTPKYCPDIYVWSNHEVTCEELNDSVKWHYVRESAHSIANSSTPVDAIDRGAASDDTQALGGTPDRKAKGKGGKSNPKTKQARASARV
jgi:DNA-binding transcriptional regulator YdaS (Cro superfamily)